MVHYRVIQSHVTDIEKALNTDDRMEEFVPELHVA